MRMPMGWKYAPAIGNRTAKVILAEMLRRFDASPDITNYVTFDADVWMDNFLFGFAPVAGASQAACDAAVSLARSIVMTVLLEANASHHPVTDASSSLTALGFVISHGAIRHVDKFVTKMQGSSWNSPLSFRDVAHRLGLIIWTTYAKGIPLCFCPQTVHALRSIQRAVRNGSRWIQPCDARIITSLLLDEYRLIAQSVADAFAPVEPFCSTWVEVFSDAAVEQRNCTWAWTSGDVVCQGSGPYHHIFIWELLAASEALISIATQSPLAHVMLFVDNTGVIGALRKGHSGNSVGDQILFRLFSTLPTTFRFSVAHTCSQHNLADPFTRGALGSPSGMWTTFIHG